MKLLLCLIGCGLCLQAQTKTADFSSYPNNANTEQDLVTSAGMQFTFNYGASNPNMDGGPIVVGNPSGAPFSSFNAVTVTNGTVFYGAAFLPGASVFLTVPGSVFSLTSIDFAKLVTSDAAAISAGFVNATTINLLGNLAGGGTVTATLHLSGGTAFQTLTLPAEWQNLSSVRISANSDGSTNITSTTTGLMAMDNVVFSTTAASCTYTLGLSGSPFNGRAFSSAGTPSASFGVATGSVCPWTASGMPSWITSTSTGTGGGQVIFQVLQNTGAERTGGINIGDKTFTIEQASSVNPPLVGKFAHVTSAGTWKFSLVEANLGTTPALGRLTFFAENGTGQQLPWTFPQSTGPAATLPLQAQMIDRTMSPNSHIVLESTGPDTATALIGSGQLGANSSDKITAFGIFSNPTLHWDAVVPLETRTPNSFLLAFDNTTVAAALTGNAGAAATQLVTGVAVNGSGAIPVIIRDATGAQIGTDTITLSTNGHISFMLTDRYPITNNKRGTIEFDKPPTGAYAVLGLRANGPALTTLPVMANVVAGNGYISHVTYNSGFTSTIYVVNTGTTSAPFTLNFFAENGSALSVPLSLPQTGTTITTAQYNKTLAPGELLQLDTVAQDALAAVSGSAQLNSTGNVSAFEIFRLTGSGQEASVPLETRTPGSFVLIFDNTSGSTALTTGVALANSLAAAATVNVIVRDEVGTQIGGETITLQGHEHRSYLLPSKYTTASGKRGMIEFVVPQGGQISAIGLRAKVDGAVTTLTTIPVLTK